MIGLRARADIRRRRLVAEVLTKVAAEQRATLSPSAVQGAHAMNDETGETTR